MKAIVSGIMKVFRACPNCGGANPMGEVNCPKCGAIAPPPEETIIEAKEIPMAAALSIIGQSTNDPVGDN
jgi:hypothetical protein